MTRQINDTFNIYEINAYLKDYCMEYVMPNYEETHLDSWYEILENQGGNGPFEYDYESLVWFLKGNERKKCLNHCKRYIEEYSGINWWRELNFWSIMNMYADEYVKQNHNDWFDEYMDNKNNNDDN